MGVCHGVRSARASRETLLGPYGLHDSCCKPAIALTAWSGWVLDYGQFLPRSPLFKHFSTTALGIKWHIGSQLHWNYLEVMSGGGGILRCFNHSRLMFWFVLVFGRVSRSGMNICKPASGVMRVYPLTNCFW